MAIGSQVCGIPQDCKSCGADTFYGDLDGSSIDKFMEIEELIYEGLVDNARTINDLIDPDPDNEAEVTYQNFYSVYLNYLSDKANGDKLSVADSLALFNLCSLCPGRYGACVYQARALYNFIYNIPIAPEVCPEEDSERKAPSKSEDIINTFENKNMNFRLYPNPASDEITIEIANDATEIMIEISDLIGRCLLKNKLLIENGKVNFRVDLLNGAYIIKVINRTHGKENRTLLISK